MKAAIKLLLRCVIYVVLAPWFLTLAIAVSLIWAFDEHGTPWLKLWEDIR